MNRYETNSKGTSPALSAILNEFAKMPKSAFDETRQKILDVAPYGIFPIECFQMFPNSDIYVNYGIDAITKNPTIKRMLSSMGIELRVYACRNSDLWEGWNNFITKGRSGKLDKQIPYVRFDHADNLHTSLPYSPYHLLNISPCIYMKKDMSFEGNQGIQDISAVDDDSQPLFQKSGLVPESFDFFTSNTYKNGQSALPGVMYCKIAKEYQNANLLQNNPFWYPENENHDLILPYNCIYAKNASYDKPNQQFGSTYDGVTRSEIQPTNDDKSMPWLNVLYYSQRKGNYFNTGSPFPDLIRGDVPTIDVISGELNDDTIDKISGGSVTSLIDFVNAVGNNAQTTNQDVITALNFVDKKLGTNRIDFAHSTQTTVNETENLIAALNKATITNTFTDAVYKLHDKTVKGLQFSLNEWRKLAALTVFRERMARTDGSYNQMIEAQFKHNPRWHEHSVIYCGGHYQPLVFSEVVQQSADSSTPLGTTAGRAFSSNNSDQIHIHADDFQIVMTVLTVTPDDFYSQGIERMWSELTQAEQYFPILNNLAPQAIKNKELYVSGTDSDDEDVFNYQELFSHFKSRQNQVTGLCALPVDKVGDIGTYIFNRIFTSKPEFNNNFVTGKFTDNENLCFASTEQAQFILRISSFMKYIAPMPAVTQPADMGLSY